MFSRVRTLFRILYHIWYILFFVLLWPNDLCKTCCFCLCYLVLVWPCVILVTFYDFFPFAVVIFFKVNKMASASCPRNTGLWFASFLVYSKENFSKTLMWWKHAIFLKLHQFLSHFFLLPSLPLVFQLYQIWYTMHWK